MRSPWTAGLGFAALSLIAQGYRYGVADHHLHRPMAAGVPPGDLLAGAAASHPTLWWPLLDALGPTGALIVHLLLLVATGAAIWRLAQGTIGDAAPWAVALLAGGQVALGGADVTDSLLLPRGAALPIELLAWAWFIEGRRGRAFVALGAVTWLHAPSAAALGGALTLVHLSERRPLRQLAGLALAAFAAWSAAPASMTDGFTLTDAHASLIVLRSGHHVAAETWPTSVWITAGAMALCVAFGWRHLTGLRRSIVALTGLALVGALGWSLRLALPVQLELWQAGRFLAVAACLAAGSLLPTARARLLPAALAAVGLWVAVPPLLLLRTRRGAPPTLLIWLLLAAALAVAARHPPTGRSPARWDLTPPETPRLPLPAEAIVAAAPVGFEGLRPGVGLYATWKDGGEGLFDEERATEWARRITVLCGPGALAPLPRATHRGARQVELRRRLLQAWSDRDPDELADDLRRDGVRYLLRNGPPPAGARLIAVVDGLPLLDLGAEKATIAP